MAGNLVIARLPPIDRKLSSPTDSCNSAIGRPHIEHVVPTASIFKDYRAGRIETWPAHASERGLQGPALHLTRNKRLVVVNENQHTSASSQLVPKPKFLQQLEEFLQKELRCLGAIGSEPGDLRLQAYRQVFGYLIEDFKTYKPLLASIKSEYETMIDVQREEINRLLPLQQMLVAVAEQCEQKILAIREQEKQEIKDLKAENRRLYEKIDELRNEHVSLHEQVSRLEEELASEYLRYRDEYDARKLLVSDINELRYQHEEMLAARSNAEALEGEKEDPVMLRIALKKSREDEASATKRMNEMIANYGDVIPRRDYEQLQKHYQIIEEKLETLSNDFKKLHADHNTLLDVHKQVLQQRDDYYIEAETLRRSATPRPSWSRCAEHVAGGEEYWKKAIEGKTSDQIVDVLLAEIQGAADSRESGQTDYFEGLGTEDHVPKYLQFDGKVRNRHIGKRDCLLYIHDVWRKKGLHDVQRLDGRREKMSDFLYDYLRQTFGLEEIAVEWAYSLRHSIEKYSAGDHRIRLFWNVLSGAGDEELYHGFLHRVSQLLTALSSADAEETGSLAREDFTAVLTGFSLFRIKEPDDILSLIGAAEVDLGCKEGDPMQYQNLFMQDNEGQTGPFLDELLKQTEAERLQFVQEIIENIDSRALVTVEEFRGAALSADPHLDLDAIDHCIQWVFADVVKPDELAPSQDRELVVRRLEMCNVHRAGPKA